MCGGTTEQHLAQSGRRNQGEPSGGRGVLAEAKSTVEIVKATATGRPVQGNGGEITYVNRGNQSFNSDLSPFPCWGLSHSHAPTSFPFPALPLTVISSVHSGAFQRHCHTGWDSGLQRHSLQNFPSLEELSFLSIFFFQVLYMGTGVCHACGGLELMP